MNLRKMLAVFLLSLVAAFAFAFDGAIVGGRDGELARKDFLKAAADEDQMYSIVESFAKGARVLRFYHVDGDNMDKEDAALLDDVTAYIKGKYTVKNRESYSHIVTRRSGLAGPVQLFGFRQGQMVPLRLLF